MSITITVPNDDHVTLRAMAKALEEIAVARGAPKQSTQIGEINIDTTRATAVLEDSIKQAEPDTTSQQVESLGISDWKPFNPEEVKHDSLNLIGQIDDFISPTDSSGTPWDERIHSASKALNSDGTWRLRRKPKDMGEDVWAEFITDVLFDIKNDVESDDKTNDIADVVEQSIVVAHGAVGEQYGQGFVNDASPGERNNLSEPSVTPAGDDFHVDAGEVTEQQIAAIPVPPLPPVFATVQEVDELLGLEPVHMTFPQVMQFLTERHGRITSAQVDDIIADMGLNSIMDLNTQPEHTGPFITRVKALLGE